MQGGFSKIEKFYALRPRRFQGSEEMLPSPERFARFCSQHSSKHWNISPSFFQ
jgi:hypothetical protein